MDARMLIEKLNLRPHPAEGGWFVETYRSSERAGGRHISTAIYYLLTPETCSSLHRLRSDEIFHFYLGDTVEMLQLRPDGGGSLVRLGPRIEAGEEVQVVVRAGVWQGARLRAGGRFALLGTTVAPGFEYADYETGRAAELIRAYPDWRPWIEALSPRPGGHAAAQEPGDRT